MRQLWETVHAEGETWALSLLFPFVLSVLFLSGNIHTRKGRERSQSTASKVTVGICEYIQVKQ